MLNLFRNWVTNTFGFSKSETNGSLLLIFLIIVFAIIPQWFWNTNSSVEVSQKQDQITLKEWHDQIQLAIKKTPGNNQQEQAVPASKIPELQLHPFDPNEVSREDLLAMGFPENVTNNMISYRDAGGSFKKKSDLRKIYGLEEETYLEAINFIEFPEIISSVTRSTEKNSNTSEKKVRENRVNINRATAHELMTIHGIGPVLSERIIKYRDLLGGFHSPDQLQEVYGLEDEVIKNMKEVIFLDTTMMKININTMDPKLLSSHPYIGYKLARSIINYQKVHGPYQQKSDIKKIKIISDSLFQKISPYISVSPLPTSE